MPYSPHPPGTTCPSEDLALAYRYETLRFHWFTSFAPDLEKRDDAQALANHYRERLKNEQHLVIH